jgi:hypothetical protein
LITGLWADQHPNAAGVIALDGDLARLTTAEPSTAGNMLTPEIVPIPTSVFAMTALGGDFVGWVADSTARWILFGPNRRKPTFVSGPLLGSDAVDFRQRVNASVNLNICPKPDHTKFAVAYGAASRIEIHDSSAAFVGLAEVPNPTNGDFVADRDGLVRWAPGKYYYGSCAATSRYLFALFSGRAGDSPDAVAYAGDQIQVFDWGGVFVGDFRLSTLVVRIALDSTGTTLYGSGAEGNVIYRFDVPVEFQGTGR